MAVTNTAKMQLLLEAPIGSMLFKLAAPNVAAVLLTTASTFADVWYVGQLGTASLASLALVYPFLMLMMMMASGAIGGGVTASLSRALGRGDNEGAQSGAWHAFLIACFLGLIFTVTLGLFSRPVYAFLGGTGEALEGAVVYSMIAFGGAFLIWLFWVLAAIIRGTGDTVTPARAILVSGVAQIGLSGALTLGWGPFPSLGIAGTATAMLTCQALGAAYMAFYLIKGKGALTLSPHTFNWRPIIDIMRVGGLGLINSAGISITVIVVTGFIGRYGTEALAGYGLGSRLELMVIPIAFGIGGAVTVAVGANFGAGNFARARRIAWTGAGTVFVFINLIGLPIAFAPGLWLDLFTADATAYSYGALYLAIAAPFYGFFAAGQTLYFACQGTGKVLLPVCVGLLRLALVATVGALAVYFSWQINALFMGVAAGLLTIGLGVSLCMLGRAWWPEKSAQAS